jgi:ABC-type transport system involved in multi-copper enzyme maturation permease subunit
VIRALLYKELRHQLPIIILMLLLMALNMALGMFTQSLDQFGMAKLFDDNFSFGAPYGIMNLVICLALTSGLLIREFDEGTIEFIDALPVSRGALFATKALVLAGIFLSLILLSLAWMVLVRHASATSIDPSLHLSVLLPSSLLDALMILMGIGLGLLLSFFRQFSWIIAGLFFVAVAWAEEFVPLLGLLSIDAPYEEIIDGQRRVLPMAPLLAQLALGAVSLLGAYYCFQTQHGKALSPFDRVPGWMRFWLAIAGVTVLVLIGYQVSDSPIEGDNLELDIPTFPNRTTSTAATRFFSFEYPTNLSDRATALILRADEVHHRVFEWLPAPGEPIPVDLTRSAPGTAGSAAARMIRLDISRTEDVAELEAILGHETVHVLIDRMTQERISVDGSNGRFFHEGLASYLEYRLFRTPEELSGLRATAAIMRGRDEVRLPEISGSALATRLDGGLVYPIGEIYMHALVQRYGEQAPARVLDAIGRSSLTKELTGEELWRDGFQAAGLDYGMAEEAFYLALDDALLHHAALVDSLPRLRAATRDEDLDRLSITPQSDFEHPWTVVARTRRDPEEAHHRYQYLERSGDDESFWVRRRDFPSGVLWYQLGLMNYSTEQSVWEQWVRVQL